MKHLRFNVWILLFLLAVNTGFSQNFTREQYINNYKDIAIRQMKAYGIPASIILAQACLESGNGNSRLAVKGNNHFGIKCHNTWKGRRIYHNDDERGECFRRYSSAEDSFKDHSEFLRNGKRYQSLFDLGKTDYKAWAHGLKAAGYATEPKYAKMLIDIIERNDLHQYDSNRASQAVREADKQAEKASRKELRQERKAERTRKRAEKQAAKKAGKTAGALIPVAVAPVVAGAVTATTIPQAVQPTAASQQAAVVEDVAALTPLKNSTLYRYSMDRPIYQQNGTPYIIATAGDDYASIAKEYSLFTTELLSFNDLETETPLQPGSMVYIGKKKKAALEATYILQEGESLYSVSQKKGIRLDCLYKLNKMKPGSMVESGKILNLK